MPGPDCPPVYNSGVLAPGGQAPQSPYLLVYFFVQYGYPAYLPMCSEANNSWDGSIKKKKKRKESSHLLSIYMCVFLRGY